MKHKAKQKKLGKMGEKVGVHGSLADQIVKDEIASPSGRVKSRDLIKKKKKEYVDGDLGHSILQQSAAQLKEINEEEEYDKEWPALSSSIPVKSKNRYTDVNIHTQSHRAAKEATVDDEGESEDTDSEDFLSHDVDASVESFKQQMDINEEDAKIIEHFSNRDITKQKTLADYFRDKITAKETEIHTQIDACSVRSSNLSPEIVGICKEIGIVLSRFKSGAVPKIFKVFPKMRCWEELVYLTNPEKWTAAAMYQAVRLFVSNQCAAMVQRFFHLVFLPRIRDDIQYYKKLNAHLYKALFKAFHKPAAFFKGIVFPLCDGGDCTLREAVIIGSVIAKQSIPVVHSAAAVLVLAELEYSGATSIFLRILINKRYVLPYRVIDSLVYHFIRFTSVQKEFPVLWHQCLLIFVQRYKNDISSEQKKALYKLVTRHHHHKITDEIRRELQSSKCRDASEYMEVSEEQVPEEDMVAEPTDIVK